MKASNRSSIITGTVLLVLAALFSISLIIQPLDFGIAGPGHNNIFYELGRMLYTVYGFSSILIPIFLLIAGISCFATKWTSKKTMRLITALIPFFTAVLTEKICRASLNLGNPNSTAVKISIAIVTGVLLIAIEIIGAGIIAESVNQKIFYRNKKPAAKSKIDELNLSFEDNENTNVSDKELFTPQDESANLDKEEPANNIENHADDSDDLIDEPKKNKFQTFFDKALEKIKSRPHKKYDSETKEDWDEASDFFDETSANDEEIIEEDISPNTAATSDLDNPYYEEEKTADNNITTENVSTDNSATAQTTAGTESISDETTQEDIPQVEELPEETADEERPIDNPASIISQEEYAALIQNDLQDETDENEEDELEWPNLPPKPETLPPEYTEDFDEDDPALEFPPKDEPKEETESSEQFLQDEQYPSQPLTQTSEENEQFTEDEASISDDIEFQQEVPETPSRPALKYSDAVNENPAFPHGIILHDEDEKIEEEKKTEPVPERKYPVKISLNADEADSSENDSETVEKTNYSEPAYHPNKMPVQNTNRISFEEDSYEYENSPQDDTIISDIIDDYEEDITLPEPDYDRMDEPAYVETPDFADADNTDNSNSALNHNSAAGLSSESAPTLDSDFFDIDMNAEPESEELSDDIDYDDEDDYDDDDVANAIFEQISEQESQKPKSITAAAQAVFSDMEADIRKEQPTPVAQTQTQIPAQVLPQEQAQTQIQTPASSQQITGTPVQASDKNKTSAMSLEPPVSENTLNPNAHHATNLTADELTDFFNAQQEQNMPVTTEIQANPPKTNQATKKGPYIIPSDLLTAYKDDQYWIIDEETKQASINLKQTLAEFNIEADIIGIKKGPVVTMFELLPAPGVKLSKIVTLQDNIALSLAAQSVRIVAPIPGKQAVGIEVPNRHRSVVGFREIIEMNLPEWNKMAVPVVLGKDILGKAQLIDLVKTPHMLIAGATGSGKSVCVNSLILSILYKRSFKDVKLILVDPKVVELKLYNNIPHLLTPVITEPKKALQALQYCLCEMERRYALLDGLGVRDISSYNQRIKERNICTEKLPYIVVIIDEFADLMATSGKELESIVARLTAMSRAVGIHLVLATQRPSVNVITGLIKANIPTRIAFMVASRTDSNIIIDTVGAEKLLGRGDMLYASAVDPAPIRIQGTFVTDQEVEDVVNAVKEYGEPDYIDDEIFVEDDDEEGSNSLFGDPAEGDDPLYDQALEIVVQSGKASASYLQRRLKIGYNRAARLVEEMEERGIVGPANGAKPREVIHVP